MNTPDGLPELSPEQRRAMESWKDTTNQEQVAANPENTQEIIDNTNEAPESPSVDEIKEDVHERNYRAIRQEIRALKEENEWLKARQQKEAPKAPEQIQEDIEEIRSDDIVEGKHLKKYHQKLRQMEQKLEESTIELRLKSKYPDFDKVVNDTSINILKDQYPELFNTISNSSDLYSKASSAYTLIKKFGIGLDSEQDIDKRLAQKNSIKPRPATSLSPQQGNSPLSQANAFANGLTPELQSQLIREMNEARKKH